MGRNAEKQRTQFYPVSFHSPRKLAMDRYSITSMNNEKCICLANYSVVGVTTGVPTCQQLTSSTKQNLPPKSNY